VRISGGQSKPKQPPKTIEFILKKELERAREQVERLHRENKRLQQENERLRKQLEEALRAAKRQAAPFSRGKPKANPKRPGRKPGSRYGRHRCRPIPSRVDEQIPVPLPKCCPECGGRVEFERRQAQYQEEIVRQTVVRCFDIEIGNCQHCGRQVQGRHQLQTSDAVGVGSVQLGPEALSLAALLNKQMGLSLGHTRQVLLYGFGLEVSRAGLCRALARLADRAKPTYEQLVETTRQSLVNCVDETGWKVGGILRWMHVAVSEQVTVYAILPGRGYEQSAVILGEGYGGFLVHDGWVPYYKFLLAFHQSCLNHLLERCKKMIASAAPAAAVFPAAVHDLLQTSLQLRDRYEQGEISEHGLRTATGRLESKLDRLLEEPDPDPANQRLARHLQHEHPFLFTFLHCPGLDATNHAAEQAIRGMVIARKVWGGNRTWEGARTQQILVSVLRTCWQQGKDAFTRVAALLRTPQVVILDIVPGPG
jgi:transposase